MPIELVAFVFCGVIYGIASAALDERRTAHRHRCGGRRTPADEPPPGRRQDRRFWLMIFGHRPTPFIAVSA